MHSQIYYLLRSKQDGRHLAARPDGSQGGRTFLLLFTADHEALSYLSAHAPEVSDRFLIESLADYQIKTLLSRWGFTGIGVVRDPYGPAIEFLQGSQLSG